MGSKAVGGSAATPLQMEVVEDAPRRKVARLYGALDDYIETEAGPKGKGLVVAGHRETTPFWQSVGVGWTLSKLGKRNGVQM